MATMYRYGDGTTGTSAQQQDQYGRYMFGLTNRGTPVGAPGQPAAPGGGQPMPPNRQVVDQGGASWGGGTGAAGGGYQPNPYIAQQAGAIQAQSNQNLAQNVMPGIRTGALANGQYGGSRQAIAEGVAAGNAQTGVNAAQANLYSNAYNTDQQIGLGYFNANNNYNLGLGQLGNQATAQNQGFYTQQRGQDLQQLALGANLFGSGVNGQLGVGSGQYGVGQQGYQAPLTSMQQYSNLLNQYTGLGGSSVTSGNAGGGGWSGAVGGALAGAQIGQNLGLGSSGSSSNSGSSGWSMPSYGSLYG